MNFETKIPATDRRRTLYTYRVSGRLGFPMDMLRYDSAWPVNPEDAEAISGSLSNIMGLLPGEPVSLCLRSYQHPTEARWQSFGWTVAKQD